MRRLICLIGCTMLVYQTHAQSKQHIQKSWIKTSVENLSDREIELDTFYTRYSFEKSNVNLSLYPAWNQNKLVWSLKNNLLTIGFDTYSIETITDTSLTIALKGFRRIKFLSEEYLNNQEEHLKQVGDYNGKPLYQANNYITPRYVKDKPLRDIVQKDVERYNIKKAAYFSMSFIITEEGNISDVQVLNGITEGFDKQIVKQLLSTSKNWRPAYFKGKPIQTIMIYEIKYLDSMLPFSSGKLN